MHIPGLRHTENYQKQLKYTYSYPRPALTVDAVVFRKSVKGEFEVLLIQRAHSPFEGMWALPGGFVDMDETVEEAVGRELKEETSIDGLDLQQLHTFSAVNRDPRHRTISVVFWAVMLDDQKAEAGDDAMNAQWFQLTNLPKLAFDHDLVIDMAKKKLTSIP